MRIAYVLACYLGPRLNGDQQDYAEDRLLYLRHHVTQLATLAHHLDTIFLVVNDDGREPRYVTVFLDSLDQLGGAPVVVIRRQNTGVSYGAYAQVFAHHWHTYDFFILVEDDYAPAKDDFDRILIDELAARSGCAYLCSLLGWGCGGGDDPHAGISNGIVRADAVKRVLDDGGFRCSPNRSDIWPGGIGQVTFSQSFLVAGTIEDLIARYAAPFWRVSRLEIWGSQKEVLLAPYQWWDDQARARSRRYLIPPSRESPAWPVIGPSRAGRLRSKLIRALRRAGLFSRD